MPAMVTVLLCCGRLLGYCECSLCLSLDDGKRIDGLSNSCKPLLDPFCISMRLSTAFSSLYWPRHFFLLASTKSKSPGLLLYAFHDEDLSDKEMLYKTRMIAQLVPYHRFEEI